MREKLFTWSGKSFVVVLLLLAGLFFSNGLQAQTTKVLGTWYDAPNAITRLTQQIQALDANIQAPPGTPSLAFLKHQKWYYDEVLNAIQGGETVPRSVEIGQDKLGAALQPDTPNPSLSQKEMDDLFKSAILLLTY